jgi:signal peptidase I
VSVLTAVLYGALLAYLGGWFFGAWVGNFSLLLLVLTGVTLLYWLAERFHFRPAREAAANRMEKQSVSRRMELSRLGIEKVDGNVDESKSRLLMQPWWLDWTAGLFPVILIVFLLRSFLFEPFKIPTGSMIPTLLVGDLILVNKYHYGIRLPVINKKIFDNHAPARGEVMVFRYPVDPRVDYIKRVVGLPGDEVAYLNHRLTINGQPVPVSKQPDSYDDESIRYMARYDEKLGEAEHLIQTDQQERPFDPRSVINFPFKDLCRYSDAGVVCKVPPGHYFMMGDNRDNSLDSRFWGFVPDENIVGRAFLVWMNFGNFSRIGTFFR